MAALDWVSEDRLVAETEIACNYSNQYRAVAAKDVEELPEWESTVRSSQPASQPSISEGCTCYRSANWCPVNEKLDEIIYFN